MAAHPSIGKVVAAASAGNMLEFYDFVIYTAFAAQISKVYFPADNHVVSLMLSFLTFGLGFLARPVGAVILGGYADRRGRGKALSLTILLMALGTGIIAFCPGYDTIGVAAPILVLTGRLIQGFSAGGETGCAVSTLVEYAPPQRRAFFAAFQQATQGMNILLSGSVSTAIVLVLTPEQVTSWGWRLAFSLGLLIVPVGVYIRRNVEDSPIFRQASQERPRDTPIAAVVRGHWQAVLQGMLVVMLWTISTYITLYSPTFAARELHLPASESYLGSVVVGLILMLSPLVGGLADRFQRRRVMMAGAAGLLLIAYPAFSVLVAEPTATHLVVVQAAIAACMLVYSAPASALLAELFPTRIRATGVSVTYSVGVVLFGGFTPVLLTALIGWTGQPVSIAYYLMGAAAISFLAVLTSKDRTGDVLH